MDQVKIIEVVKIGDNLCFRCAESNAEFETIDVDSFNSMSKKIRVQMEKEDPFEIWITEGSGQGDIFFFNTHGHSIKKGNPKQLEARTFSEGTKLQIGKDALEKILRKASVQ